MPVLNTYKFEEVAIKTKGAMPKAYSDLAECRTCPRFHAFAFTDCLQVS